MKRLLLLLLISCSLFAETVVQSDEAHYDGTQIHLKGHVYVTSEMGELYADRAVIDTIRENGSWEATHVSLEGHVRMIDGTKTQYALADRVEIFPQEKVLVFEAQPGERVLFMDVAKKMQLAANKVRAERGETDTVQGFGDVRCLFGTEELARLKSHFSME